MPGRCMEGVPPQVNDDNAVPDAGRQNIPPPPAHPPKSAVPAAAQTELQQEPAAESGPQQLLVKAGFLVVLLVLGGMLVWAFVAMLATATLQTTGEPVPAAKSPSDAAPSATPRPSLPVKGVSSLDFRLGDCFKDFDPSTPDAEVVACASPHSAQLVAVHQYAAADAYPGSSAMKAKGREACQAAPLNSKTTGYELKYRLAYPSPDSWRSGDRRVDCYITSTSGNIIKSSLLP